MVILTGCQFFVKAKSFCREQKMIAKTKQVQAMADDFTVWFKRVGLHMNDKKIEAMIVKGARAPKTQSAEAFSRLRAGEGSEPHRERQVEKAQRGLRGAMIGRQRMKVRQSRKTCSCLSKREGWSASEESAASQAGPGAAEPARASGSPPPPPPEPREHCVQSSLRALGWQSRRRRAARAPRGGREGRARLRRGTEHAPSLRALGWQSRRGRAQGAARAARARPAARRLSEAAGAPGAASGGRAARARGAGAARASSWPPAGQPRKLCRRLGAWRKLPLHHLPREAHGRAARKAFLSGQGHVTQNDIFIT